MEHGAWSIYLRWIDLWLGRRAHTRLSDRVDSRVGEARMAIEYLVQLRNTKGCEDLEPAVLTR